MITVLVVDAAIFRNSLAKLLLKRGFHALEADGARAALRGQWRFLAQLPPAFVEIGLQLVPRPELGRHLAAIDGEGRTRDI